MKYDDLLSFCYLTHLDNLESILENGILSRDMCHALRISPSDISDGRVQSRRHEFHGCVPLFFADNTPMLWVVMKKLGDKIALLEVDKAVLRTPGAMFSDGNLASCVTNLYENEAALANLDWHIIYNRRGAYSPEWKRVRSAEVLVPDEVGPEHILAIHVASPAARRVALVAALKLEISVDIEHDLRQCGIADA